MKKMFIMKELLLSIILKLIKLITKKDTIITKKIMNI